MMYIDYLLTLPPPLREPPPEYDREPPLVNDERDTFLVLPLLKLLDELFVLLLLNTELLLRRYSVDLPTVAVLRLYPLL